MASYAPQIIQQPTQEPFNLLQNPVISAYASAMLKQKFSDMKDASKEKKQQGNLDKFLAFAKANGKEVKYHYGPGGLGAETINAPTEKPVTLNDLKVGAAGALPANKYAEIGKNMSIAPEMLPPEQTPGAVMSLAAGGIGDISGNPLDPVQADYGQTVAKALRGNSMVNKPPKAPAAKAAALPDTFATDFKAAHDAAAGDSDKFVANLKDLALQYSDNPKAIGQIKKLVDLNKPAKKSGRASRR